MSDRFEEVRSALSAITVCTREDWLRVCWAIEHEFGEEGRGLWVEFSQRGYGEYDARETEQTWRRSTGRGKIPVAWVFLKAREAGWTPDRKYEPPTQDEIDRREAQRRSDEMRMEEMRDRGAKIAADVAKELMSDKMSYQAGYHPYFKAKGVNAPRCVRVSRGFVSRHMLCRDEFRPATVAKTGHLIVPIYSPSGEIVSVQTIDASGDKRYLPGSRRAGGRLDLPFDTGGVTVAVEGLATGLSIRQLLPGWTVRVCFDTAGLRHAATDVDLIAADNDENGAGGEAAKKAGVPYIIPPIVGMDWNDYHQNVGLAEARRVCLEMANTALGDEQ